MPQIVIEEFRALSKSDVPRVFTQTRDFRFHRGHGKLVHHRLPLGPKGYVLLASASTGHDTRFVEKDRVALTFPVAGTLEVRVAGRSFITRPGGFVAIGPSDRRSMHIPADSGRYRAYTIIAPSRAPGEECWTHRSSRAMVKKLTFFIQFAFRALGDTRQAPMPKLALAEALIEDVFAEALHWPDDATIATDTHREEWMVRAAQAYIDACFSEPLSIGDLAGALGVSTRSLQSAFQHRRGTTPKQFLTEVRLRGLRTRLAHPEPTTTVTSASLDSGILHVGRCIQAYRRRYGESPAATLRRARPHANTDEPHRNLDATVRCM